ncbi:MAG: hypothetical protein QOG84_1877 [Sphingomonadales bacterium]|jgi:hypothetical protein|nr:hypothetical protein [Sphingomonadales bacterium]
MRYAAAFALAALIAAPARAADGPTEPVAGEWVVSAFKQLCVDPFGDRAKLERAVAAFDPPFEAVAQDPQQPMPGSTGWRSARALLGYSDGNFLPKPLPNPQCTLNVRPAAGYDHAATAAALASALGLPAAKARGGNGRFESEWNFKGPAGEKRRLFLSQEPRPDGPLVRVSLLNMR